MRRRLIYLFLLIMIAQFSGCAYYNTFHNARQFYGKASKERKKRERLQVVELSPEEQQQLQRQGNVTTSAASRPNALEMQNYQKAIEKASSLLEFYPNSRWVDDALMMVGECFYFRGEYTRALRKFEEIVRLYPQSEYVPRAHLYMAKTMLGLAEFDNAEKKFRDIALDQNNPNKVRQEAEYELAGLYYVKQAYEMAAEEYRRTARESGDELIRAMSLYRLGECLVQLGEYDQAPAMFKRAVESSPNPDFKSQATIKWGEAQSLVGDYQAAIRTFSNLLSKELEIKRIPVIKLHMANNYRLRGDLESAIKWYRNIIEEHKSTEGSAQSYHALGEIEEFVNIDYRKAKENYDLVRGEASTSKIAVKAKERSDYIKDLLDLRQAIDVLLGIATETDSLDDAGAGNRKKAKADDASIDLSSDGMWMNYAGRDRPAPRSKDEMATENERGVAAIADSAKAGGAVASQALPDSVQEAERLKSLELKKVRQLAEKRLALAELYMFNFDKPDSAMQLLLEVVESKPDTLLSARALYSIGYIMRSMRKDTVHADSLFRALIYLYPESPHAEGARRFLGQPLLSDKVDSALFVFTRAEEVFWKRDDVDSAIALYASIPAVFPESPYAPKAQYGIGWLYENVLHDYDKAIGSYKAIVENYPESVYGKELKTKLARHEQAIQAIEARKKAIADSIAEAKTQLARARQDSLAGTLADSTQTLLVTALNDSSARHDSLTAAANRDTSAVQDSTAIRAAVPAAPPPQALSPDAPPDMRKEEVEGVQAADSAKTIAGEPGKKPDQTGKEAEKRKTEDLR